MNNETRFSFLLAAAVAVFLLGAQSLFIVDEREQALVLQFGKPVRIIQEAGLKAKIPFIQQVEFFDRRILDLDPGPERVILSSEQGGLLAQLKQSDADALAAPKPDTQTVVSKAVVAVVEPALSMTAENPEVGGEPIIVDAFARYKIVDPLKFKQRLSSESAAQLRLQNEMDSSTRDVLGRATLEQLLSKERARLMREIRDRVNRAVTDLGIEIVDIRIGRADLTDNLRQATYDRMKSEREQRATEIRSRGQERALEIRSNADKQRAVILSEADRESRIIRGRAEQEASKLYAESYKMDADFYGFYRSLEAYRRGFGRDTTSTFVLSPDSDFMRVFRDGGIPR
jgi:membrane protease subunit HflC